MSKQVIIEKAKDPLMWYADKIGQTIPVEREDDQYYWAREDAGFINIILKDDAREV